MKSKKSIAILIILSVINTCFCVGVVAYNWGYMQSSIDNRVAYFSAPAYVAIISGIPFIIAAIVFAIIAIILAKKK